MEPVNSKRILKWELIGAVVIILAGSGLHFLFAATGEWAPIAIIAAVNESTWEHLKLAFWPALIWGLIEWPYFKSAANFCLGKAIGLLLMPILIIVLFYGYEAITGSHSLAWDIGIFVAAIIIGQIVSYKIAKARPAPGWTRSFGIALIIVMLAAFSLLTFYAPQNFLFQDPVGGGYGITEHSH